jgi:Fur family transcriptional regulator, stress-responsive regulator
VSDPAATLRARGLRVTAGRVALLESLDDLGGHPDAPALVAATRERLGTVSTQAVYDALAAFTDAGLLRRIDPPGSAARYEARTGDNHHHLICRSCRAIVDVDCAVGPAPCLEPDDDHGYVVDEAEVTFWGTCPACRT